MAVMTIMMTAHITRVNQRAIDVAAQHSFHISLASTHNTDAVRHKFVICALPHISSKHERDAHLLHDSRNA